MVYTQRIQLHWLSLPICLKVFLSGFAYFSWQGVGVRVHRVHVEVEEYVKPIRQALMRLFSEYIPIKKSKND
jgi:hypothetical protein